MDSSKTAFERVDQVVVQVIKLISYISGVCLVGIMLVAFFNMLGEKLGTVGLPLSGIPEAMEIIQYLHIPVVFLAAAYVTLDRGHVRIDLLSSKFHKVVQQVAATLGNLCGIGICSFISYRGFVQMGKFIDRNRMSSTSSANFPLWPFALIMAIGFALLALSFLWSIIRQYAAKDKSTAAGGAN